MNQSEINAFVTDMIMNSIVGAQKTTPRLDSVPAPFPSDMRVMAVEEATIFVPPPWWVSGFPQGIAMTPVNDTADEGDEQTTDFQVGDRVMVIDEAGFEGILHTGDILTISGICGDHRLVGIHEAPGQWFAPARFIAATEEMEANRMIEDLQNEVQELEDEAQRLHDQNDELQNEVQELSRNNSLFAHANDLMKHDVIGLTQRVQELLDANNAEVERRRVAEARVEELAPMVVQQSLIISALLANRMFNN